MEPFATAYVLATLTRPEPRVQRIRWWGKRRR
jgi:hypothetical protein